MAFADSAVSSMISVDWFSGKGPSKLNRVIGWLFNIWNKDRAIRRAQGGTWDEIKENNDFNAAARGVIWLTLGTACAIGALVI